MIIQFFILNFIMQMYNKKLIRENYNTFYIVKKLKYKTYLCITDRLSNTY